MKLWARHWLKIQSRKFGSLREEAPLVLLSIEKGAIGEGADPVQCKPVLRPYMSNIFIYFMPEGEDPPGESVHGWELKLGLPLEEAEEFADKLLATIGKCEKRREERHKEEAGESDE